MVPLSGIDPESLDYQSSALPLSYRGKQKLGTLNYVSSIVHDPGSEDLYTGCGTTCLHDDASVRKSISYLQHGRELHSRSTDCRYI